VGKLLHFLVVGFEKHLVRAGEIFLDLLVLTVLGDDFGELSVLLGDLLEPRRVGDELLRGELIGQLIVTSAKLIEFLRESDNGHWDSFVRDALKAWLVIRDW
jgi:hypothetical protein